MQNALYSIARAEGDAIIWAVIIIATVLARLIKAAKGSGKPPPVPGERPSPGGDFSPEAELRKFLEGLAPQPDTPPAPPVVRAPPPPLPVRARRPISRARPPQAVVAAAPAETAETEATVPLPLRFQAPAAPVVYETRRRARLRRGVLRSKDLRGVANLRRAVALREVLDVPVGLR